MLTVSLRISRPTTIQCCGWFLEICLTQGAIYQPTETKALFKAADFNLRQRFWKWKVLNLNLNLFHTWLWKLGLAVNMLAQSRPQKMYCHTQSIHQYIRANSLTEWSAFYVFGSIFSGHFKMNTGTVPKSSIRVKKHSCLICIPSRENTHILTIISLIFFIQHLVCLVYLDLIWPVIMLATDIRFQL